MQQASSIKDELEALGAFKGQVAGLYEDARLDYNADKFGALKQAVQKMSDLRASALDASSRIIGLRAKLDAAESEQFSLPQSNRLLIMAAAAFERGDYETAMARLDEADLTYSLETAQTFSPVAFVKKFYPQIIAGLLLLAFASAIIFMDVRYYMLKNELSQLGKEEDIVLGLIKEAQDEYFEQGRLATNEYTSSLEQYDSRLSKIVERKVELETLIKNFASLKSRDQKLLAEKARLEELVKELQSDYLEKGKVETRVYENRIKSYTTRLSEVEEQIALFEAETQIRKQKGWLVLGSRQGPSGPSEAGQESAQPQKGQPAQEQGQQESNPSRPQGQSQQKGQGKEQAQKPDGAGKKPRQQRRF